MRLYNVNVMLCYVMLMFFCCCGQVKPPTMSARADTDTVISTINKCIGT